MTSISKKYGKVRVLQDVSLNVAPGEVVGLFGRDGAGKTVCFECIMGLVKLDAGHILLNGKDITCLTVDRRGPLGLSYLSQETSIFRGMTTSENINAVLEQCEPDPGLRMQRLDILLSEFNIDYVRDTPAPRLSGGERRRCEIARAMATSPSFMLLDEPFAGVDPLVVISIEEVIVRLKNDGIGILISDQNVHAMLDIIDRAYVLHMGQIIFDGSRDDMIRDENVHQIYLGDQFKNYK